MSVRAALAAVTLVALVAVTPARGYDTPAKLREVAAVFALRAADVRCPSRAEWDADPNAAGVWSYANLRSDYAVLGPEVCAGALGVTDEELPAWQRAAGVLALVHESYHLRHWRYRRNEARVSCAAIRHFLLGASLLGATFEVANGLLPYALALHVRTTQLAPSYADPACRLPVWTPPI